MLQAVLSIALLWGALAIADGPTGKPPEGGAASQQGAPPSQGLGVKVWDDRVFDLTPKADSEPQTSREGRTLAEQPDYNSEQRQQWLDACRNKDGQAYRDCYNGQKTGAKTKQRQDSDSVARKLSGPNSIPLVDEQRGNTQ